jgi:hypothetical protein
MKLSVLVTFILLTSAVFFIFSQMVSESNDLYGSNINSSEWDSKYDYVNDINGTISPLYQKFTVIQDETQGFFTKLAAGITAIPYAVIVFPQVIFGSLVVTGKISTGFLAALAIPGYIITLLLVGILTWALFKLLEFFQRSQV